MKSYLKSRLYEQLKLHGHIPDLDKDTDPAARIDSDIRKTLIWKWEHNDPQEKMLEFVSGANLLNKKSFIFVLLAIPSIH